MEELDKLKQFFKDEWSVKESKIALEKSLDDLGMYGDDKRDFLKSFFEKFNIESNNINYDKFCEPEVFNPLRFIFFRKEDEQIVEITISHLVEVIKRQKWFDPN